METKMNINTIMFILMMFLLVSPLLVLSDLSPTQKSTLNYLLNLLQEDVGYSYWNASTDPCSGSWDGVTCTDDSVTQLDFSDFEITNSIILSTACQIESLQALHVSRNHLNSIPDEFFTRCGKLPSLKSIDLSQNRVYGNLASFREGGFSNLESLDMSSNLLYGTIESLSEGLVALKSLKLGSNHFTGSIPSNLVTGLEELDLSYNRFQGRIPEQLANCSNLTYLHLSYNKFSGELPITLGNLKHLRVLSLDHNSFVGKIIPHEFTQLSNLTHLTISSNLQSGFISPSLFAQLHSLQILDLSNNRFSGTIPELVHDMLQLTYLNLSRNKLSGNIPSRLGIGYLSSLDLSYNNLSGPIPPLLREFNYDAFVSNLDLCGKPVTPSCGIVEQGSSSSQQTETDESKNNFNIGLYVSIGIGFYFGFWGVCGTLVLKHTWRYAFFNFVECLYNRIYVTIAIYVARKQRKSLT